MSDCTQMVACSRLSSSSRALCSPFQAHFPGLWTTAATDLSLQLEMRVCCKPLGAGERLDSQLLGCDSSAAALPRNWKCQPLAGSTGLAAPALLLSISAPGQARHKPRAVSSSQRGKENRPRNQGSKGCLPGETKSALQAPSAPQRAAKQTDVQPCPSVPSSVVLSPTQEGRSRHGEPTQQLISCRKGLLAV